MQRDDGDSEHDETRSEDQERAEDAIVDNLGNVVGGVGLVTVIRLIQVGAEPIEHEREAAEDQRDD